MTDTTTDLGEDVVEIPAWVWESMAPVLKEALTFWWSPDWLPIGAIPNECFRYEVPIPLGDDPSPLEELQQWFRLRRGDEFLPLYQATWWLASLVKQDDAIADLIGLAREEE